MELDLSGHKLFGEAQWFSVSCRIFGELVMEYARRSDSIRIEEAGFLLRSIQAETDAKIRAAFRKDPSPEQIWRHHSGRFYRVTRITNRAHPSEKFPIMVSYVDPLGDEYSRKLSDWHPSFTFVGELV